MERRLIDEIARVYSGSIEEFVVKAIRLKLKRILGGEI